MSTVATGVPGVDVVSSPERGADGKVQAREGAGAGGRRIKGDAPPGVQTDDAPSERKPTGDFAKSLGKAFGKTPPKGAPQKTPVELPAGVEDDTVNPALEEVDAEAAAATDALEKRKTGKAKVEAMRNKVHPPKAPEEPAAEAQDGAETAQDGEDPLESAALRSFNRKFGLKAGLASTTQARDNALDQFAQIVGGQAQPQTPAGQAPSPSGATNQPGFGQPHHASGPQQQASARPPGSELPSVFDQSDIDALTTELGPEATPRIVGKFQEVSTKLAAAEQQLQRTQQALLRIEQREGEKLIRDFFSRKVGQEGFRDLLGTSSQGLNQAQQQLRNQIVRNAAIFQNQMPQLSDDDCLEMSLQHATREHQRAQQQSAARKQLEGQVISRNSQRSLVPMGAGSAGRGGQTEQTLRGSIRSFIKS